MFGGILFEGPCLVFIYTRSLGDCNRTLKQIIHKCLFQISRKMVYLQFPHRKCISFKYFVKYFVFDFSCFHCKSEIFAIILVNLNLN